MQLLIQLKLLLNQILFFTLNLSDLFQEFGVLHFILLLFQLLLH